MEPDLRNLQYLRYIYGVCTSDAIFMGCRSSSGYLVFLWIEKISSFEMGLIFGNIVYLWEWALERQPRIYTRQLQNHVPPIKKTMSHGKLEGFGQVAVITAFSEL